MDAFTYYLIITVNLTPKEINDMDLEDLFLLGECHACDQANRINVQKYYNSQMKKPKK